MQFVKGSCFGLGGGIHGRYANWSGPSGRMTKQLVDSRIVCRVVLLLRLNAGILIGKRALSNRAEIVVVCYLLYVIRRTALCHRNKFALLVLMARFDPRIAIAGVVGLIVQIAVTILAWGDWYSFFSHPTRSELVVASVLLTLVPSFSGTSPLRSRKSSPPQTNPLLLRSLVP